MQIILIEDVPHLGSLGDEVQVKDGYARNFLLPRGMAIQTGSKKFREIEHHRKRLEQLRAKAIASAKTESEKVAELELVVKAKAGANGKLFGSITNRDIQAVLAEQGYTLDRRSIQLQVPIKNVGAFTVSVRLHTDVKVDVNVRVVPDTEDAGTEEGATPGEEGEEAAEGLEGQDAAQGSTETAAAEGAEQPAGEAAPEGDSTMESAADAAGDTADAAGATADGGSEGETGSGVGDGAQAAAAVDAAPDGGDSDHSADGGDSENGAADENTAENTAN